MNARPSVHFTDIYLSAPTNPVTVNLIGAGGTGSKVLTTLVELNHALIALKHPGLTVRLWDDDVVTEANLGRQRFAQSELGLHKSVALINRANRWAGTKWKAETVRFEKSLSGKNPTNGQSNIYISCVDTVNARFGIAEILKSLPSAGMQRDAPKYWMDFGNSQYTGQVILSTIGKIRQPESKLYEVVESLPFITEEYGDLLLASESSDDTPSCSLEEALLKQDLFINGALAQLGSSLLWSLFRQGMIEHKGFFLNLKDFRSQPIRVA